MRRGPAAAAGGWARRTSSSGGASEIAAAARAASNGPGSSTSPPASRVWIANRSGALWCSGESTRCRSAGPKPQSSISSAASAPGVVLGQDAGPHALAAPRRPGRVVHRPGQRHVGEVGLGVPQQRAGSAAEVEGRDRRPRPAPPARPPAGPGRGRRGRCRCAARRGRRPAAPARPRRRRAAGPRPAAPRRPAPAAARRWSRSLSALRDDRDVGHARRTGRRRRSALDAALGAQLGQGGPGRLGGGRPQLPRAPRRRRSRPARRRSRGPPPSAASSWCSR